MVRPLFGREGPWDQRTELALESKVLQYRIQSFSIQSSHSKIITHSFKQLFHQFIHFLFCKKAKQYVVGTCLFHFAIQGMSRRQRKLFSARLLTKIFICINIHHSLIHLKTFIEQLYALISVLDAQIHDRNLLSWSLNSSEKTNKNVS